MFFCVNGYSTMTARPQSDERVLVVLFTAETRKTASSSNPCLLFLCDH